jgi:hypothetical protein
MWDSRDPAWETTLGTIQHYQDLPVYQVRLTLRSEQAASASLTNEAGTDQRAVDWEWDEYGQVLTADLPDWLTGLISTWHDNMSCVLGHLHCEIHDH